MPDGLNLKWDPPWGIPILHFESNSYQASSNTTASYTILRSTCFQIEKSIELNKSQNDPRNRLRHLTFHQQRVDWCSLLHWLVHPALLHWAIVKSWKIKSGTPLISSWLQPFATSKFWDYFRFIQLNVGGKILFNYELHKPSAPWHLDILPSFLRPHVPSGRHLGTVRLQLGWSSWPLQDLMDPKNASTPKTKR